MDKTNLEPRRLSMAVTLNIISWMIGSALRQLRAQKRAYR